MQSHERTRADRRGAGLRQRQDHLDPGAVARAAPQGHRRRVVQGRPGLHRSGIPRPRVWPAMRQSGQLGHAHRDPGRPDRRSDQGRRARDRRGRDGSVRWRRRRPRLDCRPREPVRPAGHPGGGRARMAASAAALVEGFTRHRDDVEVAGVVFNRVGSESHADAAAPRLRRPLCPAGPRLPAARSPARTARTPPGAGPGGRTARAG